MEINEKIIKYRIEPYIQEATIQVILDILLVAIVTILMIVVKFNLIYILCFAIGYSVIAFILHYRVVIQAIIDKRKKEYITETVSVKSFVEEFSFIGDRLGHSYIRHFYPKDMQVQKKRIKVVDSNGEGKKLRSVMSFKRSFEFVVFDKQQIEYLQVTYLKRSKILVQVELAEKSYKKTSKKDTKVIEKALHIINTSV